jgi:3D (Asp-Asp-Asp) domain-containing protein
MRGETGEVTVKTRALKIIFVLLVGWSLGYQHYQAASEQDIWDLRVQVAALEREAGEMRDTSVKKVRVITTAYSNDVVSINVPEWREGKTATGMTARRGHAASDWNVFPPGTRLYVPGYGVVEVQDRGGAIRGHRLDLFMDSPEEAIEWGVKAVDVYVLEPAPETG